MSRKSLRTKNEGIAWLLNERVADDRSAVIAEICRHNIRTKENLRGQTVNEWGDNGVPDQTAYNSLW